MIPVEGFKYGVDFDYSKREEAKLEYVIPQAEGDLIRAPGEGDLLKLKFVVHSDSIDIDNYDYDGVKNIFEVGLGSEDGNIFRNYRAKVSYIRFYIRGILRAILNFKVPITTRLQS